MLKYNYVTLNYLILLAEKKKESKKKKVIFIPSSEKGKSKLSFWNKLYGDTDYNPDNISIRTYEKMLNDPQAYAGLKILSLSIFAKGYDFKYPGEDKEKGDEMRKYLQKAFKNVNRTLVNVGGVQDTFEAFTENALSIGYSVSEIVYDEPADDGYIYMKKWKVLPARSLDNCFDTDDYGNLERVVQFKGLGKDNEVIFKGEQDFFRLLVWSHNMKGGNWYGNSEYKRIYDDWYSKGFLIKFWNIALERYGAPWIVAYINDEDALDDVMQHLDKARTKTNFGILEGNKLEVLESKTNGMFGYRDAIKYHDEQIMRGMLIPTLIMGIEQTGARALGETHFDLFSWRIIELQNEFSSVVQTLINRLIDINFGPQEEYPYITFPPLISKDKKILADMVVSLVEKAIVNPDEEWIRDFLSIPQKLEDEDSGEKPKEEGEDDEQ